MLYYCPLCGKDLTVERLTNTCSWGNCPEVHRSDDNRLIVSGPEISDPPVSLDEIERAVQIPAVLVVEAVTQLGDGQMTWTDLGRMFQAFTRSAFRFETLPRYEESGVAQESLEHFLATGEVPAQEEPNEWDRLVSSHREAGRSMRRVHTVRMPLTDYLRWELTFQHQTSNEEIRVLDLDQHSEFVAIEELGDAWIFDERVGVRLCYDEEGRATHPESLEDDEVATYLGWRDKAWQVATPLAEFMAELS